MTDQKRSLAVNRMAILLGIALVAVLSLAIWLSTALRASASSHREAPLISKDQYVDNTDTYVFISPENDENIVLAASWIPFEGAEGGPNYYEWDDNARYELYIDNDGDATADITYTLESEVIVGNPLTFLYNTGPIDSLNDPDWNRKQYYTVTETLEDGSTTVLVGNQLAPPVNIGGKSTPNYQTLADAAIYTYSDQYGDVKIFAGQTDDPFWVDLQVFDLLTLRGQAPPIGYEEGNIPVDSLAGFNVHSLVIELPIDRVTYADETVLGVWAGASRPTTRVLSGLAGLGGQTNEGPYVQVSRLGMPLVNEAVLPIALKDAFNTLKPAEDLSIYVDPTFGPIMQESVEDPELGNLLCGLYGVPLPAGANCETDVTIGTPRSGRGDIFDIFLLGMVLANEFTINTANGPLTLPAGFNVNRPANPAITAPVPGVQPSEMIRINTAIKGELCSPTPSRLGVLGGDACGFPNGRRLMDDVIEIELLAVAGAAYEVLDDRDETFTFNADLIGILDDGLDRNDVPFRDTFPYLALANAGKDHLHTNAIPDQSEVTPSATPAATGTPGSGETATPEATTTPDTPGNSETPTPQPTEQYRLIIPFFMYGE